MTLYEIDKNTEAAIEAMLASVNEETGEVDEEAANALETLQIARKDKLESIGCVIKNLMAEVQAIKDEASALTARAKQKEKDVERLKSYVAQSLLAANENKFEGVRCAYSFRKSTAVEVMDESAIPEDFKKTTTSVSIDRTALGKALKDGQVVDGATLVIRQNLQVK